MTIRLAEQDAVCLIVDKRLRRERRRIDDLFRPRVKSLDYFVVGQGRLLHPDGYDQTWTPPPPGWHQGEPAWSHWRALHEIVRRARDADDEAVLLIEDDCVLLPGFDELVEEASGAGIEPDILWFGGNFSEAVVGEWAGRHLFRLLGNGLTTHLIRFARSSYDAVLAMEPSHVFDRQLANEVQPRLSCWGLTPVRARQAPGWSTLWSQQTSFDHLFDRAPTCPLPAPGSAS